MDTQKETARYQHDCAECKFLGQYNEYDLYTCNKQGEPTMIGRYGNEGAEYTSGLPSGQMPHDHPIHEAQKRAVAAGLLKRETAQHTPGPVKVISDAVDYIFIDSLTGPNIAMIPTYADEDFSKLLANAHRIEKCWNGYDSLKAENAEMLAMLKEANELLKMVWNRAGLPVNGVINIALNDVELTQISTLISKNKG